MAPALFLKALILNIHERDAVAEDVALCRVTSKRRYVIASR